MMRLARKWSCRKAAARARRVPRHIFLFNGGQQKRKKTYEYILKRGNSSPFISYLVQKEIPAAG